MIVEMNVRMIEIKELKVVLECSVDYERVAKSYLQKLLQVKLIKNNPIHNVGIPDFKYVTDDGVYHFVEIKSNGDGVRKEQLEWMLSHINEDITIYWIRAINTPDDTAINKHIPLRHYDGELNKQLDYKMNKFRRVLREVFKNSKSIMIEKQILQYNLINKGIILSDVRYYLDSMIKDGELFEPKGGYLQIV
jgi:hypothetical protein